MVQMVHGCGSPGTCIWGESECLWFWVVPENGEGVWGLLKVNAYGSEGPNV
jgi:hypothetical protein